jgi:hypothetical protein
MYLRVTFEPEFEDLWMYLKSKYPAELFDLDGVGEQLDLAKFSKKFFAKSTTTTADASIDANANVDDISVISYSNELKKPLINITAPLTDDVQAFEVNIRTTSEALLDLTPSFVVGRQVLSSGNSYSFTGEDVAKFSLTDTNYGINPAGKIGTRIKDNEVTISYNNLVYNGKSQTVGVSVKHGENILKEGRCL